MTPQPEIPEESEIQIIIHGIENFDDDDYDDLPSADEELESMTENALLYPQNHSEKQLEVLGLSLEDVWGEVVEDE